MARLKEEKKAVGKIYTSDGTLVADMSATLKNAEQLSDLADIVKKIQDELQDINSEQELMSEQMEKIVDEYKPETVSKFVSDIKLKMAENNKKIQDLTDEIKDLEALAYSISNKVVTLEEKVDALEINFINNHNKQQSTYYTTNTAPF